MSSAAALQQRSPTARRLSAWAAALVAATSVVACAAPPDRPDTDNAPTTGVRESRSLRLSGTIEAVRSQAVVVPRLSGATLTPLVITRLVRSGTRVEVGDVIVEFDRQEQERVALDRRAEVVDLDGQIAKKKADQAAAQAKDDTEITQAENDVARARLEVRKNIMLAKSEAEKNTLTLDQAIARLDQLRKTYDLKRKAATADLRILEIRRGRAENAMNQAIRNAGLMEVRAPFAGLVVLRTTYRSGGFVELQEGDEVRPGQPVLSIVDTSSMIVRARINQADGGLVREGQKAIVRLDGFPELRFDGRVEDVAPIGFTSQVTMQVRSFMTVVSIAGTHPQLLPDLTASVEIAPDEPDEAVAAASRGPS